MIFDNNKVTTYEPGAPPAAIRASFATGGGGSVYIGTRLPLILTRHILPNCIPPLIVQATYVCASAMLTEAILSFLGAGTPPTIPSWGNMVAEGRLLFQIAPWNLLWPGVALAVTILSVNILGDGLRDRLDPKLAKRM
jgi:peptide/nickel transport system permease protein